MSRRAFLEALALVPGALGLTAGVLLQACGDDSTGPAAVCDGRAGTIGANHGHTVCITLAQSQVGVAVTLLLTKGSGHTHQLFLSDTQVQTIKDGFTVGPVDSTVTNGHSHPVTFYA